MENTFNESKECLENTFPNEMEHPDPLNTDNQLCESDITETHLPVEEEKESDQPPVDSYKQLQKERDQLIQITEYLKEQLKKEAICHQEELDQLAVELASEREAASRREVEMERRLDQVTSLFERAIQEKDNVVSKLGLLESEKEKLINELTTAEQRLREIVKESERSSGGLKKLKSEASQLQSNLDKSDSRCSEQSKELTKLREEVSSLTIKIKWAQNKLKAECDGHKETKSQLQLSSKRVKEAKEEGEQIRADLKKMIQQYQSSEEMRSNSLDIKLKKTEKELKQHEQEIADQLELHELTVKELELTKASHKISQEEVKQYKAKLSDMSARCAEHTTEIEDLKSNLTELKDEHKKLSLEKTEVEKHSHNMEGEHSKLTQLQDAFSSLQKSHQHLEREVARRKEKEAELLTLTEKLSSANAELQAERSGWDTKISSLTEEREDITSHLSASREKLRAVEEKLVVLQDESRDELERLTDQLHNKSKAVEELSMALEDEREAVKAKKKKNTNNIRDLQRQLQHSNRRIEQLESSLRAEHESPATLPITEASRTSSQSSLDGIINSNPNPVTKRGGSNVVMAALVPVSNHSGPLLDEERAATSPSPELPFQSMDGEKMFLVDKLCNTKKDLAKQEEKLEFFEEHALQLTEDIQRKSKIIQSFIMREQSGVLAPAAYDEHKVRQARKGGIMATVFTGGKGQKVFGTHPEMTYELSLEMNRKMQSVLEDTLLKNITLKESIDTLGKEIQRLSAQLQSFESSRR